MNKRKIAWITDSTALITPDLAAHPDLFVVPMTITFGDDSFEDGVDLSTQELYYRIRTEKTIPKTSQPALGKFTQLFDSLKANYDLAIAIHVSGQLSGTAAGCRTAAELSDLPVEVVDSKSMSVGITNLIYQGMALAEQGMPPADIVAQLLEYAGRTENYILLGNLDQFYKGGRMSGTQYLLGSLLQIKPIIHITEDGTFALFDKVRSEKNAQRRILDLLDQALQKYPLQQVQILHGNVLDKAQQLATVIRERYPQLEMVMGEISSTIAVHAGEGTLVLAWQKPLGF